MTPADAVTEPIERITTVPGAQPAPVPVARSVRRARRARRVVVRAHLRRPPGSDGGGEATRG